MFLNALKARYLNMESCFWNQQHFFALLHQLPPFLLFGLVAQVTGQCGCQPKITDYIWRVPGPHSLSSIQVITCPQQKLCVYSFGHRWCLIRHNENFEKDLETYQRFTNHLGLFKWPATHQGILILTSSFKFQHTSHNFWSLPTEIIQVFTVILSRGVTIYYTSGHLRPDAVNKRWIQPS